jgi:hypothetical protein
MPRQVSRKFFQSPKSRKTPESGARQRAGLETLGRTRGLKNFVGKTFPLTEI